MDRGFSHVQNDTMAFLGGPLKILLKIFGAVDFPNGIVHNFRVKEEALMEIVTNTKGSVL